MSDEAHSPLGASSAKRWMNCPGSVALSKFVERDDEDPDYRAEGTAAHEVVALALARGQELWEFGGYKCSNGISADSLDMAALQVYLDYCRSKITVKSEVFIEHRIGAVAEDRPHPAFFGTLDFCAHDGNVIYIADLKYGMGIPVPVEDNPQQMYYAYGFLRDHPDIDDTTQITLAIVQPRIEWDEPVKTWATTAAVIREWGRDVLIPKMQEVAYNSQLEAGEHCRFCPAKLVCPLMKGMFRHAATTNSKWLSQPGERELVGEEWKMISVVKMYIKAVEEEAMKRLLAGQQIAGIKLVDKRANRVWKPGATDTMLMTFGDDAYAPRELKSPAELEKLGGTGKLLVSQWAYQPKTGYSVAAADDPRAAVGIAKPADTFKDFLAGVEQTNE